MRTTKTLTLATLLIALAAPALAQYGEDGSPRGNRRDSGGPRGNPLAEALARLDLGADQADQTRSIVETHRAGELGRLEREHRAMRNELGRLVFDPQATEDAVARAAERLAAHEQPMALARHRLALDLSAVLTPDQLAQLQRALERGPMHHRRHAS